jgi:hypothetical protein
VTALVVSFGYAAFLVGPAIIGFVASQASLQRAMLVPVVKFEFWWVFCAFLLLETMVGMFNSCGATLRSRYYPEGLQSSIMTVFRLPLNFLVVIGTKLTDQATDVPSLQRVFAVIAGMHVAAMLLQVTLHGLQAPPPVAVVVPTVAAAEAKKAKASKPVAAAAPTPVAGKGAKAASAEKKAAAPKEETKSSAKSPKSPKSPKSSPKEGKESKKVESVDKKGGKSGGKEKGVGGSTSSSKKKLE